MNLPIRFAVGTAIGLLLIACFAYNPLLGFLLYVLYFGRFFVLLMLQYFFYSEAIHLMNEGKYDLALFKLKKSLKWGKPLFTIKLLNQQMITYNIATVYGRMGEFEESLIWLDRLNPKKLPKALVQPFYALYAFDLMHLNRNLDLAEEYLQHAIQNAKIPFVFLSFCYLCLLKQDLQGAANYVNQYENHPHRKRESYQEGSIKIRLDRLYISIIENFYLGLYYHAIGDIEKAKEHLFVPAMSPYDNFHKREAYRLYNSLV